MLKHILVPIDGSEVAERALDYVPKITQPDECHVTLLTALDVPEYPVTSFYPTVAAYGNLPETVNKEVMPQAKEYLSKTAESLQRMGYKVSIDAIIGEAAEVIVEKAVEDEVEAIVMSTHGRSGISRWLLGSVANKVLNSAPCPVFIIPAHRVK